MKKRPHHCAPTRSTYPRHLFELFPPAFVKDYPDAQVEIAYADMAGMAKPDAAKNFSVFDLQAAAHFAETKNIAGCNVYVGAALRNAKSNGRAICTDVLTSCHSWADFDDPGDDKRVDLLLKGKRASCLRFSSRPDARRTAGFKSM